jgi:hypothetical protein
MRALAILLSFLMIVNNNAQADVILPKALFLTKGMPAPYDGALLTSEQAKVIYGELKNYDKLILINQSLGKSVDLYKNSEIIYQKEIIGLKDQNVTLENALEKSNNNNFWMDALLFVAGVVTTSAVVYVTRQH